MSRLTVSLLLAALVAPAATARAQGVVINEIHYHPAESADLEFVELHNPSAADLEVSRWRFDRGIDFTFPDGVFVPAGGFLVVARVPDRLALAYGLPGRTIGGFDSALANSGERLRLTDADGLVRDEVDYDDAAPWPEAADGEGGSLERVCAGAPSALARTWTSSRAGPSPGRANAGASCPPPAFVPPPVVIHELHYHPAGDRDPELEYVELLNTTAQAVGLDGWSFGAGIEFRFPPGSTLPPGELAVVGRNPAALRAALGVPVVHGPFAGSLSNDGERLELLDASGAVVDVVRYADEGDWPAGSDGTGRSLEKIVARGDGDDAANWSTAGSAGAPVEGFHTVEASGAATSSLLYFFFEGNAEGLIDDLTVTPAGDPRDERVIDGGFDAGADAWELAGNHAASRWQAQGGIDGGPCLRVVSSGQGGSQENSASLLLARELTPGADYRVRFALRWIAGSAPLTFRLSGSTSSNGIYARTNPTAVTSAGPTPGAANTRALAASPPLVSRVQHFPQEPASDDTITLTAAVRSADPVARVILSHRTGAGAGRELALADDGAHGDGEPGDGIFGARLEPQRDDTLVRFRLVVETVTGTATFPRPGEPSSEYGVYVSDVRSPSLLPLFHILCDVDVNDLDCSTYVPAHFVYDGEVYLDVGIRNRGQSTCRQTKRNLKLRFNRGRYFDDQRRLNLNSLWPDKSLLREKLLWDLRRDQGRPYCKAEHVRVHVNGEYHGLFLALENVDRHFLDRNGLDSDGSLYKAINWKEQKGSHAEYAAGYEKKNPDEGDIGELFAFLDELNDTGEGGLLDWIHENLEIEAVIDYQAVAIGPSDVDHTHKNRFLYRDGESGRWWPLVWDVDLSFGRRWYEDNGKIYNDEIVNIELPETQMTASNALLGRFFGARSPRTPAGQSYFQRAYLARLRSLLAEKFNQAEVGEEVAWLRELLADEAAEDLARWGRYPPRPTRPDHPPDFDYNVDELLGVGQAEATGFLRRRMAWLENRMRTRDFPLVPAVRITEIRYNPPGSSEALEFLELHNGEPQAVDVAGWYLRGIDYEFPPGSTLAAGAFAVIAKDPAAFRGRYGDALQVFGPYAGNLSNDGERLRLYDARPSTGPEYPAFYPITVDFVAYDDTYGDPARVGDGHSLELRDLALDNDLPQSWAASLLPDGSPGTLRDGAPAGRFLRGDVDGNGALSLADPVGLLFGLLRGGSVGCESAADTNDDGRLDLADAVELVSFLFVPSSRAPAAPFPSCGADPTTDSLTCAPEQPCAPR